MEWLGFWIFMAAFVCVDGWLFSKGYNSWFFRHRTQEEKDLRKAVIRQTMRDSGL